jgi:cystathionine beta-lyase
VSDDKAGGDTRLVAAGRRRDWTGSEALGGGVVNVPVWRASTILFDSVAALHAARPHGNPEQLFYGRHGTPTQWALAEALTGLEPGADGTALYPSGVAAIAGTLLALLSPGDELLMVDSVYGPTRSLCDGWLKRMGIVTRYYDPLVGAGIADLIGEKTRAVFCESPGSLTFEVQDVPAIAAAAKAAGALTIIDNTWATSLLFPALAHGCDVAILACTKYVVGHSDVMLGSVTAHGDAWRRIARHAAETGQHVGPDDAYLALRGLRTLAVRLRQHEAGAIEVARWLDDRDEVGSLLHPAFASCQGHAIWSRDFAGASGLFAFSLRGASAAQRDGLVDALTRFGLGYSWGGYESLALPVDPVRTVCRTAFDGPLVRLHIGLEDPADLIADLARGLDSLRVG